MKTEEILRGLNFIILSGAVNAESVVVLRAAMTRMVEIEAGAKDDRTELLADVEALNRINIRHAQWREAAELHIHALEQGVGVYEERCQEFRGKLDRVRAELDTYRDEAEAIPTSDEGAAEAVAFAQRVVTGFTAALEG